MFDHYLITRFNVKVTDFGPEKMISPDFSDEWLNDRLFFFTTYCVPSVLGQINNNFTWNIYFDTSTPQSFLNKLSYLLETTTVIKFRLVDHYQHMLSDIAMLVQQNTLPFAITTRLDNDDIISNHFIQSIQLAFVPVHNTIINFTSGYEYSLKDNVLKRWNHRYKNQFISIIEDTTLPGSGILYSFPHKNAHLMGTIVNIPGSPRWMYLRHHMNVSKQIVRPLPVFSKKDLALFPESVQQLKLSAIHTSVYSIKWVFVYFKNAIKKIIPV